MNHARLRQLEKMLRESGAEYTTREEVERFATVIEEAVDETVSESANRAENTQHGKNE